MPQRPGRIEVIAGCMFAGKTEELIARLRGAMERGLAVRAFKHSIDNRYDPEHLVTHRNERFDADRAPEANEIERRAAGADVIGIDEGHFFGVPLIAAVERLRDSGKRVIIVGLENDAWGRPFDPMPQLAAIAELVTLKRVGCTQCGRAAMFTQRMIPIHERTMVGGVGEYEPRCREHFVPLKDPPAS